jgi:CMP-N-acetylneuraminic acid synthetase
VKDQSKRLSIVTVYIPCRNYGHYLAQAVASVKRQLYKHWELFIIDDASVDRTAAIADDLRRQDPERIKVLYNTIPFGLQRIANRVLDLANGRYIVRLDADDWFDESALLLMVAKLESDPLLGLVYGNYFYTNQNGRVIGVERRHRLGAEHMTSYLPPHGACTMVRTRVLKAVGGYSDDVSAQDGWELWYKLAHRVKAASLEAPLFYYRQHEQSLSRDVDRLLTARANILAKTRAKLEGSYVPSCLAVIPVRESYPDFQGVPYRQLLGKSLLQHALESAQNAEGVTEIAVSSDSQKVLDFSRELTQNSQIKSHMQIARPQELAGSHIHLREILIHAAEQHYQAYNNHPDIILFLSLHAPFRQASHVDNVIDVLRISACDTVVTVCEEREPVFIHGKKGLKLLNPGRFDGLQFERETIYRFNGAVISVWWEVLKEVGVFGENIGHVMIDQKASLQIKSVQDIKAFESQAGKAL